MEMGILISMVGMGSTTARRLEGMKLGRKGFESIQDARMKMGYGNRMLLGDGLGKYKQASFNDQVARTGWAGGVRHGILITTATGIYMSPTGI